METGILLPLRCSSYLDSDSSLPKPPATPSISAVFDMAVVLQKRQENPGYSAAGNYFLALFRRQLLPCSEWASRSSTRSRPLRICARMALSATRGSPEHNA